MAGFNQFFYEARSTEAWRYGAAIDQKFSHDIYVGGEFSKRDLEVPAPVTGAFPDTRVDWEEYLGRAYVYWAPHEWFSLRAEYLYEKFDRDRQFTLGVKKVKTHSFPLGVDFFHPSGLTAGFKTTYYHQEGTFQRFPSGVFFDGEDDFWLVDAAIGYRLPKRYGFITVGVNNLFDEEFKYFETDVNNSRIQPDRFVFFRVTFAIP